MNKVILKGRLTGDPELHQTVNGVSVTDFSIAVNRRFNKDETDFINCQAWKNSGEFVSKYFKKGQEILVSGELHIDKWDKDGQTRYTTRVVVDNVEFCGSKADNNNDDKTEVDEDFGAGFEEIQSSESELPF